MGKKFLTKILLIVILILICDPQLIDGKLRLFIFHLSDNMMNFDFDNRMIHTQLSPQFETEKLIQIAASLIVVIVLLTYVPIRKNHQL